MATMTMIYRRRGGDGDGDADGKESEGCVFVSILCVVIQ